MARMSLNSDPLGAKTLVVETDKNSQYVAGEPDHHITKKDFRYHKCKENVQCSEVKTDPICLFCNVY